MYATVRTYVESPELADDLVKSADEVKRIISEIDGFRAYYLIRTADGAVSVSIYDSESGVEESTKVAAAWIRENLPGFNPRPVPVIARRSSRTPAAYLSMDVGVSASPHQCSELLAAAAGHHPRRVSGCERTATSALLSRFAQ